MKALFLKWQQAFEQLSQRERLLIALSSLAIIGWLSWLPVESFQKQISQQKLALKKLQTENKSSQQMIDSYKLALAEDPNQEIQQQLAALNQQQQAIESQLQAKVVDMVPAEQMPVLLEQILQKTQGNKLLALESIAPSALLSTDVEDAPNLYRHGIRLKLSASYFDFLDFVKAVDAMPKKLYWQRLNYQVKAYPNAEIELELYSLSCLRSSFVLLKTKLMIALLGVTFLPPLAAKSLIDPTRPSITVVSSDSEVTQATNWQLTSIVTGDKPFAIIDNQLVQVGEHIHGVKVTSINTDAVELSDGRRIALYQSITEPKG